MASELYQGTWKVYRVKRWQAPFVRLWLRVRYRRRFFVTITRPVTASELIARFMSDG